MALKKEFIEETGVDFENAYHRVVGFSCPEKDSKELEIIVKVYKDQSMRNKQTLDDDKPYKRTSYFVSSDKFDTYFSVSVLNENNANIWKKAYEYLKNEEPYFSDAIDLKEDSE